MKKKEPQVMKNIEFDNDILDFLQGQLKLDKIASERMNAIQAQIDALVETINIMEKRIGLLENAIQAQVDDLVETANFIEKRLNSLESKENTYGYGIDAAPVFKKR